MCLAAAAPFTLPGGLMAHDEAPMTNEEYFRFLDTVSTATRVGDVERVRREVLARWRGDPSAERFADMLYAREQWLEERDAEQRSAESRAEPRTKQSRVERTHATRPMVTRQSVRRER
jgi:hypothetical protein